MGRKFSRLHRAFAPINIPRVSVRQSESPGLRPNKALSMMARAIEAPVLILGLLIN